jgi:type II secretory pathway predicted ATPase ExeA
MYEDHFGLVCRPFSKTPDPAFLYEGRLHAEALARLELAVEDKDVALLTGEIGAGKTTLSRALIDRLDERFRAVLVINPRLSPSQLLALVAERLGVKTRALKKTALLDALTERLFALYEEGSIPLIIIDEAQMMSKLVFEELRLLTNLSLDHAPLVGLLLIGQPELRNKLGKAGYRSFAQRVGMAYHLGPLDERETGQYVAHRLAVAGRGEGLFTEDAIDRVHAGSHGIPRSINTICQNALLVGYGHDAAEIDATTVDEVLDDLATHLGPMWAPPRPPAPLGGGEAR